MQWCDAVSTNILRRLTLCTNPPAWNKINEVFCHHIEYVMQTGSMDTQTRLYSCIPIYLG